MEKQQRNPEEMERAMLHDAQQTAAWLVDYLYGDSEPAEIVPAVTQERLSSLFQDSRPATWLGRFKSIFAQLEAEQQAVAGLYVAGYPHTAIEALAERSMADMFAAVQQRTRLRDQQKPNFGSIRSPQAYIPLKIVTDQLREPAPIDEVKLKEACHAINELEPSVLAERLRQLPQYLPAPTKDSWLRVVTEWLDGRTVSELAEGHGFDEHTIAAQLTRMSKVFLKQYAAASVHRALTRDDLEWQTDALCAQTGGDYFFPDKGEPTTDAKKTCAACEVREQCDDYRKRTGHTYGVFAGKSPRAQTKKPKA